MRYCHLLAVAMTIACSSAVAQTPLSAYADSNGFIDVQKLTCAQLANTFQEDADYLTSGTAAGTTVSAKKHTMQVRTARNRSSTRLSVHCKANPGKKVIEAIDVVFKEYRAEKGIKIKQ